MICAIIAVRIGTRDAAQRGMRRMKCHNHRHVPPRTAWSLAEENILWKCRVYLSSGSSEEKGAEINNKNTNPPKEQEWRKRQLEKLERKFTNSSNNVVQQIESDEELQPMWSSLERRVKHRKPLSIYETGGRIGRGNSRPKTDEDMWLQEGLYDDDQNNDNENDNRSDDEHSMGNK